MNDETLVQALSDAYPADPPSNEQLNSIARRVRVESVRRGSRRKFVIAGCLLAGFSSIVGFAYPAAQVLLFGLALQRKMAAEGPYMVKIAFHTNGPTDVQRRREPLELFVDGTNEYILDPSDGGKTFQYIDASHSMHSVHTSSKIVEIWPPNPNVDSMLRLPFILLNGLKEFGFAKRIESRGTKILNGRQMDIVALKDSGKDVFLLDLDAEKGIPISATFPELDMHPTNKGSFPSWNFGVSFDYTYGSAEIKRTISGLKQSMIGFRELRLDQDRQQIASQLFAKAISETPTGRDKLKIYQVQQNAEGDVFVLYTCRGYHAVEDNVGRWVQLKGDDGKPWLSEIIDMDFSKLAPKGEGLKAQIFFHPDKATRLDVANLSIRLNEWEYLRSEEPSTRSTRTLKLCAVSPTEVAPVPIWFFYAFGIQDESWVTAVSQKLRFTHALAVRDFPAAIRVGVEFEKISPEALDFIFYNRKDLDLGLAQAFRGVGDLKSAEKYEEMAKVAAK